MRAFRARRELFTPIFSRAEMTRYCMLAAAMGQDTLFASERDRPIAYMQRTRDWYLALGYGNPYVWAHYTDVPFQPLKQPLARSRVALVTTAAPYQPDKGDQ